MGCGICGFVGLSDRELLKSMCGTIRHRGPDDTGYFLDRDVGLGIDRLKVIDLVTGDQPIHNEDSSVWVVFNGEVYNYASLRSELEARGHDFYTSSDTETIVHSYEEWGDDCVSHLRGMFAFAIWDQNKRRLYFARDRFGKKPFFYSQVGNVFLFGSEIKAILQYQEVGRAMDYEALDHFFTYMYIPSPLTIFRQVRKLPPGCYGAFQGNNLSISRYWDFRYRPEDSLADDEATVELLYRSLEEATRIRMRSDVPIGAFLSGGVDSSTVVALMSRVSEKPVKSVSIGFDDGESELRFSRLVADFIGTDHHEYVVTPDAYKVIPDLIRYFDEPFADHSFIPTYYLSKVTRNEVTVALSGDGGDEMFMGYPFLTDPSYYRYYSAFPSRLRKPALGLLLRSPANQGLKRMAKHALDKDYADQPFAERFVMRVSLHNPRGLSSLYSGEFLGTHKPTDTYRYMLGLVAESGTADELAAVDYATIRSYLEEDILVKVDRMSMAVALETRCPLLDQDFADLVGRIPMSLKLRGGDTKHIFKRMAVSKGLIPREIAYRKKMGFGAPIGSWMKKDWKELTSQALDQILSGRLRFFDRKYVSRLLTDPDLNANKLFALTVFTTWHRMYVDEAKGYSPTSSVA